MKFNTNGNNFSRPQMRIGPGFITPFIKAMLIINAAVFVMQMIWPNLTGLLGFTPKLFFSDFPNFLYTPLTYMFLHGSIGHILFNMFALWMFGTEIERSFGPKRFGRFYISNNFFCPRALISDEKMIKSGLVKSRTSSALSPDGIEISS